MSWLLNISSLKGLYLDLRKEGFDCVQTRRLCQDCLEHFFGQIRKGSGNAKSITSRMFCSSFQRRWGLHYINVVVNGNCEEISPDDLMPDYSVILEDSVSAACCNDEFYSLPNPVLETSDNSEDVDMHYHEKEFLRVNAFNYNHSCNSIKPNFCSR
ncbi:hypothetical protein CVS40_8211 [Lucilia cuprina]|nr:hypothetical protein CVS40_8211 [Lucilia cuprina]